MIEINPNDKPRLIISAIILLLFGYAFFRNPNDQLLIGALIVMATSAKDFWFGTSKGSSDKSRQLERQADRPASADEGRS